jgi:pseudaminic acid synthase
MKNSFSINNRKIGISYPPYIIAEMSANHNGNIDNAFKIIDMAKICRADAVKLQTYTADTLTLNSNLPDFIIDNGLWRGQSLYQLYDDAFMPWEWHKPLFDYAKKSKVTIFSSPFDNTAIDLLEDLNSPAYKIASFEIIDLPLVKYAAETGKPLILSTGMANANEIEEAVVTAKEAGCKELALLHCVSAYPAYAEDYNLNTISDMKARFGLVTGLSDHTIENTTAITSIALGASIIEKHVTLDKNGNGPDDSFSLEMLELKELCSKAKTAWKSLGTVNYKVKSSEQDNIKFRRSLYFVKSINKGEIITSRHIRSIRPGYGLSPKNINHVIGRKVLKNIELGTAVKESHINWDNK